VKLSSIYSFLAPLYRLFLGFPLFGLAKEQRAASRYVKGKRVLEVGCGTGYMLARISSAPREVTGLDISHGMLLEAAKRLKGTPYKVRLVQASYFDIPFPDNTFDCVLATFTHAPDQLPVAREIARCLVPGGRLVIVDVGPSQKPTFLARGSTGFGA
jgi:ubiquinone/menaquinone biosynthesis C-methylase UbiE